MPPVASRLSFSEKAVLKAETYFEIYRLSLGFVFIIAACELVNTRPSPERFGRLFLLAGRKALEI
jgi:hypothetical protein